MPYQPSGSRCCRIESEMQNSSNSNNAGLNWVRRKPTRERWNRPDLQNGSSIFWRAIEARRAPRSEMEREHLETPESPIRHCQSLHY